MDTSTDDVVMDLEDVSRKSKKRKYNLEIDEKKKKIMNRLRDGIYSPPSLVDNLRAKSCTEWTCKGNNSNNEYTIIMKQSPSESQEDNGYVYFECTCGRYEGNKYYSSENFEKDKSVYCKHIISVIIKLGLNQIKRVGLGTTSNGTTEDVINMLKSFSL